MELDSQLRELVKEISPTNTQQRALRDAHIRLRERLMTEESLKSLIVGTFLQGSYRRRTGIRPQTGDKPDVDIVVVTRLNRRDYTPRPPTRQWQFIPAICSLRNAESIAD